VPTRPTGVYPDSSGRWYFKARLPKDPINGRHEQITRRGFRTAVEAGKARRELIGKVDKGELRSAPHRITVSDLLNLHLVGLDADQRLSEKTRYDYRHSTEDFVRPHLGNMRLRDVTPEAILAWQRKLTKEGGTKRKKDADGKLLPGRGLSPNTVRLARSPLAGAFKLAMSSGMITINPVA
jgi:hypothetical protein